MVEESEVNEPVKFRIRFVLNPEDQQGFETENLWAEPVGAFTFRLLNSPFYVYGVSAEDIVSAEMVDGQLSFRDVIHQGGHSTYRLLLQEGRTIQGEDFAAMWMPISKLGATYENANGRLIAVDIPPDRDIQSIYSQFETGKAMGVWVFEEANCQSHAPWRRNGACGPCLNRH